MTDDSYITLEPWEIHDSLKYFDPDDTRYRKSRFDSNNRSFRGLSFGTNFEFSSSSPNNYSTIDSVDSISSAESANLSSTSSSPSHFTSDSESSSLSFPSSSTPSKISTYSFHDESLSPSSLSSSPSDSSAIVYTDRSKLEKHNIGGPSTSFVNEIFDSSDSEEKIRTLRASNLKEECRDDETTIEYVDSAYLYDFLDRLYHRPEVCPNKLFGASGIHDTTRVIEETTLNDVCYMNFDDGSFFTNVESTNEKTERIEGAQKSKPSFGILGSNEKFWTIEAIRTSVALVDTTELNELSKSTLKKLLLRLHPDKNQNSNDPKHRLLFEKVYRVYSQKNNNEC